MSDLEIFPLGRLRRFFLLELANGSLPPESTVFTGGLLIGTALLSSRLRLIAKESVGREGRRVCEYISLNKRASMCVQTDTNVDIYLSCDRSDVRECECMSVCVRERDAYTTLTGSLLPVTEFGLHSLVEFGGLLVIRKV